VTGHRVVSYGGGQDSTALLVLAAQQKIDFPTFLFANVGNDSELPATLRYVDEYAKPYAAAHGIELAVLHRTMQRGPDKGQSRTLWQQLNKPGSRSIDIPVRMANGAPGKRKCTGDFKIKVVGDELARRDPPPPAWPRTTSPSWSTRSSKPPTPARPGRRTSPPAAGPSPTSSATPSTACPPHHPRGPRHPVTTDLPYTDTDLRAEAASSSRTVHRADPDFRAHPRAHGGRLHYEVQPPRTAAPRGTTCSARTTSTRPSAIDDLLAGAADVSEWAINLGADGLEPSLQRDSSIEPATTPIVRIHARVPPRHAR
jgi:hypothetical protein